LAAIQEEIAERNSILFMERNMKLISHIQAETPVITPDGAERRIHSYGGNIMLVQFTFTAGTKSWEHSHPHEQVGYVQSGEIDFFMEGNKPVRLLPGDSYFVPSNLKHYIKAITPTVLVDCFTPIREDFLK
jgi:quercetin dioxygenase-like cupin family protein